MAGVPIRTSARSRSLTSPRTTIGFRARIVATGGADLNPAAALDRDVVDGAGEGRDHVQLLDGGLGLAKLRLGRCELGPGNVGSDLGALAAREQRLRRRRLRLALGEQRFRGVDGGELLRPLEAQQNRAGRDVLAVDGRQGADHTAVAGGKDRGLVGLGAAGRRRIARE